MKGEKRQVYRDLINLMPAGYGLCNFCQYADWSGSSCCDGELECQHPLPVIQDNENDNNNAWQGDDCWGFRPTMTLQELGEVVSITSTGNNAHKSKKYGGYIAIIPSNRERKAGLVGAIIY